MFQLEPVKSKLHLILLAAGLMLILAGDYYFGRRMDLRDRLIWTGLAVMLASLVWMLVARTTAKEKYLWLILLVVGFLAVDWLSPMVSSLSLRRYIAQHRTQLEETNRILTRNPGEVALIDIRITGDSTNLNPEDRARLEDLQRSLGAEMIYEHEGKVRYELWGFLDDRIGLTYVEGATPAGEGLRRLEDRWYW